MKKLKSLAKKIKESKEILAKERDSIEVYMSELESLMECYDDSIEGLDIALININAAIQDMSRYV